MKEDKNAAYSFEAAVDTAMAKKPVFASIRSKLAASRNRKQKGELSLIEAGAVLGVAALLALAVYVAVPYVRNFVQSLSFTSEVSHFHTGIQSATETDADFTGETLTTLAQNHAFDAAGSRVASDFSAVTGMFGGTITGAVGKVTNANDAFVLTYTVPVAVCAMGAGKLASVFQQVDIGATTVFSPTVPYKSSASGAACAAGATATVAVKLYTTRS
ncbi:type 4 pilus major pilin [Paraburkholderia sp. GAS32]|uniref:type 4 pilus major pilin n=1 Tax=Paraburkholderia sp. GAS32 TaxID=3035129 RepID=UPI003D22B117